MESADSKQCERVYSAVVLLLLAVLLVGSIYYTEELWQVKVGIALVLLAVGGYSIVQYLRLRR